MKEEVSCIYHNSPIINTLQQPATLSFSSPPDTKAVLIPTSSSSHATANVKGNLISFCIKKSVHLTVHYPSEHDANLPSVPQTGFELSHLYY